MYLQAPARAEYIERNLLMSIVKIDLSSFLPDKQAELKKNVLSLATDDYITIGHPELLTVVWDCEDSIEKIFPELAQHLTYQ